MRLSSSRWQPLRRAVLERDGYRCRECGRSGALEVDHVVRRHDGGSDALDNLQSLCRDHHLIKTRNENTTVPRDWEHRETADRLVRELT